MGEERVQAHHRSQPHHRQREEEAVGEADRAQRRGAQPAHHGSVDQAHQRVARLGEGDGAGQPEQLAELGPHSAVAMAASGGSRRRTADSTAKSRKGRVTVRQMATKATRSMPTRDPPGSSESIREERNAPAAEAACCTADWMDMKRARSVLWGTLVVSVL